MIKLFTSFCLLIFSASFLYSEIKIPYLSGEVLIFHKNKSIAPAKNMKLSAGDKIKTLANSKALLLIDNRSRVWISQNSEIMVSSLDQGNAFNLFLGKIKAKVKLFSGQKFRVQTPISVASVRGTEFISSADGQLLVNEGIVDFSDINMANKVDIKAGMAGGIGADGLPLPPRDMLPEEIAGFKEEWQGYGEDNGNKNNKEEGGKEEKGSKDNDLKNDVNALRSEMHEIVGDIKTDINTARELTNEIKETDLSEGRTLRDVHGNVVRVEQHLLRPDNQTLQLLNLTKRTEYNYSDRQKWGFTVPSSSRLDIVDVTIKMNMNLPDQLTDWPSFISSKGDDLHPQNVNVKMTNQEDSIEFKGEWKLKDQPAEETGKTLSEDRLVFKSYINGWEVDADYKIDPNSSLKYKDWTRFPKEGEEPTELYVWAISPQMKLKKTGEEDKYVVLYTEGYVINNDGKVLDLRDLISSSTDPFTKLKQIAGEEIVFCRDVTGPAETSFFKRGNLDIVTTPDLVISIAQKLAGQLGDITKSSDK